VPRDPTPAASPVSAAESVWAQDMRREVAGAACSAVCKPLQQAVGSNKRYRVVVFGGREGLSCMRWHAMKAVRSFHQTGVKWDENQNYMWKKGELEAKS